MNDVEEGIEIILGGETATRLKGIADESGVSPKELVIHILLSYLEEEDSDDEFDEDADESDEDEGEGQ